MVLKKIWVKVSISTESFSHLLISSKCEDIPFQIVSIFIFYVNHCSLTFSDIITLLTGNSVVHFPEFLPGVSPPGKVNYLIIFLKGAIKCALNIWDGLKAIELPDRPWTTERHCKRSSFVEWICLFYYFENIKSCEMTHLLACTL